MSNNLERIDVTAAQNQKTVTIAESDGFLDAAITELEAFPVDNTNTLTLTAAQFTHNFVLQFNDDSPVPTALVTVTVPVNQRGLFEVFNNMTQSVQIGISGQSGALPLVAIGASRVLQSDGVNVSEVVVGSVGIALPVLPVEDFIFIPVEEKVTPTAAGGSAALATVASGANLSDITSLDFDQTTAEHAQLRHIFEEVGHMGNVSFQFLWSHAAATTFGLALNAKAAALSNDDTIATAFGTARKVIDTGGTTDDHYLSDRTGFVKIATPAQLDLAIFDLFRDPVDAGDNLDVDARLQGIIINFWRNVPLDPDWTSVVLMAGFDGEDTATDEDDESDSAHVATYVGNAQIDTAESQFSRGSALFDVTGDAVTFPDSVDWNFAAGDFTMEGWVRWTSILATPFQHLFGQFDATATQRSIALFHDDVGDDLILALSSNGSSTAQTILGSFIPNLNQWYHIATDFDGTTYRIYVDGAVAGTGTTLVTLFNSTAPFSLGNGADVLNPFDGRIDEMRVTKGVARFAGAFTAPTSPFPRG